MPRPVPKRSLDEVAVPRSRFRIVWLDAEVTRDFLMYRGKDTHAYRLLHKKGSYVRLGDHIVTAATWAQAMREANTHGADFIVIFHGEAIKHRYTTPNGAVTWERAIFFPDEATAVELTNTIDSYKGADEHGRSRTSLIRARQRAARRGTR